MKHWQEDKHRSGVHQLPERSQIDPQFQWRLEDIFENDAAWEKAFKELEETIPRIANFRNRLGESAQTLLECLKLRDTLYEKFGKIYLYAGLHNDENTAEPRYQAFRDRATSLMVQLNHTSSFIQPEILSLPEEKLRQFISTHEGLKEYQHFFDDLLRSKAHVLPPEQEQLLALGGELAQAPYTIFSMFNNADLKFPAIKDEQGREVEVTKGRFHRFMESRDRRVRKDAFFAMYGTYANWTNSLAAMLTSALKRNIFYARARKYDSALHAALDPDNIPITLYENVVQSINENLAPLQQYSVLRKKILALDELHPWDLFVPIVSDVTFDIPYEEAQQIVQDALHPLGEEYLSILKKSFQEGWIDVFENKGKRSGAYSWATYGVHPYILLNYDNTLKDVFTLAHELGHAMHSYYSHRYQPYHYSRYTIFVAEVASTLNESLLMDYMLKHTTDPSQKLYLLNEYADKIRGTVYIQTLFAEFEKNIHEKAEAGEGMTAEVYNKLCRELYTRYMGKAFVMDEEYDINWCRIPHFYYNFYVYKYVTGFSAAVALAQKILDGDKTARDAYLRFLTRGSSDYSLNLLKDAGVDMTTPEPLEANARLLKELVDEMEKTYQQLTQGKQDG
ncbi:MAG: oligoendopeptidase F [Calditrichaeota bacterium]|nr:MAG: oligoendopeptidase F [Calditrichota bacterium]